MPYVELDVVGRVKQIDRLTYVIQKSQNCHHLKEQYVFTDRKKCDKVVVETNWKLSNWKLEGVLHMDFPFYDAPNTATIICCHIIDDGKPIYMYLMMKMMECGNFCVVQHMIQMKQDWYL